MRSYPLLLLGVLLLAALALAKRGETLNRNKHGGGSRDEEPEETTTDKPRQTSQEYVAFDGETEYSDETTSP